MASYSIKDIEKLSGIKAHTIRMWERRYGLVIPKRTETNIRYYSDEDLKYILNISILNQDGLKISKIAKLSKSELHERVNSLLKNPKKYAHIIDAMLFSLLEMDEEVFIKCFMQNLDEYGLEKSVESILFPFFERIGILWQTGTINPSQEHFISNLFRQKLLAFIDNETSQLKLSKGKIIFFLPENELHEFSLLFYSYIARKKKFEVIYLGACVPLDDLREIQAKVNATAFFTAFINGKQKNELETKLRQYKKHFPDIAFYVTGLQIKENNPSLPEGFVAIPTSDVFKKSLDQLQG